MAHKTEVNASVVATRVKIHSTTNTGVPSQTRNSRNVESQLIHANQTQCGVITTPAVITEVNFKTVGTAKSSLERKLSAITLATAKTSTNGFTVTLCIGCESKTDHSNQN